MLHFIFTKGDNKLELEQLNAKYVRVTYTMVRSTATTTTSKVIESDNLRKDIEYLLNSYDMLSYDDMTNLSTDEDKATTKQNKIEKTLQKLEGGFYTKEEIVYKISRAFNAEKPIHVNFITHEDDINKKYNIAMFDIDEESAHNLGLNTILCGEFDMNWLPSLQRDVIYVIGFGIEWEDVEI